MGWLVANCRNCQGFLQRCKSKSLSRASRSTSVRRSSVRAARRRPARRAAALATVEALCRAADARTAGRDLDHREATLGRTGT